MQKRRKRKWGRWLLAFLLMGGMLWTEHEWNLRSNFLLYLIRDTQHDLLLPVPGKNDWESVFSIAEPDLKAELDTLFQAAGLLHCRLPVRRASEDWRVALLNLTLSSHLNVLEFDPEHFRFEAAYEPDFALSSAGRIASLYDYRFVVNANYFDENDRPLGAVIHKGREVNRFFPNWTGFFFVKNGKPWFGPRSLLDDTPGEVEELLQGYPSIMKDHQVFDYVHLKSNPYFNGNAKTYRSLAGMRQDGRIVWILSGRGGILDVRELATLAEKLDLQHATLFDGGSSLQYRLDFQGHRLSFQAVSERFTLAALVPQLEKVRPPVYIGILAK